MDPAPTLPDLALGAKCSGWYVAYCDPPLGGGECVWAECDDGKDKVGGGLVYVGSAILGVSALDHSSSGSGCIEDVTAAAASGDAYSAVGLNGGGRGCGAWSRGSGA